MRASLGVRGKGARSSRVVGRYPRRSISGRARSKSLRVRSGPSWRRTMDPGRR